MVDLISEKRMRKTIARTREAQDGLEAETTQVAHKAQGILKSHRYDGDSFVTMERANPLDWFVVLNDTAGQGAANVIEYGRPAGSDSGFMEGIAPLHKATGLPRT